MHSRFSNLKIMAEDGPTQAKSLTFTLHPLYMFVVAVWAADALAAQEIKTDV